MITLQAHALNRVVACNGSHFMPGSELPEDREQTDDQREGIAAHWVAMEAILGRISDPIEMVDRKAPNGVYVTPDMAEYVDGFVQDVSSRRGPSLVVYSEENVDFQLSEHVRIACRLDLATYDHTTGTLTVDDFKYGWRLVEVVNNWQLVAGAMGWCTKHQISPARIVLNIHQPRPHHEDGKKRSWVFERNYNALWVAFNEALATLTQELHTGPHCYKCPAMRRCPAYRRATYNAMDAAARVFDDQLTNEEIATEVQMINRALDILKQAASAYEELILHRINSGTFVKDWFVSSGRGHAKWNDGVTADMIRSVTGIDITKPGMLSPAQAKKKGVADSIINAFSTRPATAPKIVNKSVHDVASRMFKPPTE